MENIIKTHEWKLGNGKTIAATSTLILSKTINADGDKIEVDCCELDFTIRMDGMWLGGTTIRELASPKTVNGMVVVAIYGKLGLNAVNLAHCKRIIAETKAHPAWIAKIEGIKKSVRADEEYERHCAMMKKAMQE